VFLFNEFACDIATDKAGATGNEVFGHTVNHMGNWRGCLLDAFHVSVMDRWIAVMTVWIPAHGQE
jgi:hypothetical protein